MGDWSVQNWRQLIDILAQDPKNFAPEKVAAGLRRVKEVLPNIPESERLAAVRSLSGRLKSAPLVQLLSADHPAIAATAIMAAQLDDDIWAEMIPSLPTRARGFLRNRNDLGPKANKALMICSKADFVLPDMAVIAENPVQEMTLSVVSSMSGPLETELEEPAKATGTTQISDIVARIESLRQARENGEAPPLPFAEEELSGAGEIEEIRFETDDNGLIVHVEGAPRGALVGLAIGVAAFNGGAGTDAYGAAAFRHRMPFENVRMHLTGAEMVDGEWRVNAAPQFDGASGRFRGYRGIFRRPNISETAIPSQDRTAEGEQMQQLVHELRTPLGAIIGFSEIIEQQLFGPVSFEYRTLAANILKDAQRLLTGFDDLSIAARIETGRLELRKGVTECGWLLQKLADRLRGLSDTLSVTLNLGKADPVRDFAGDTEFCERLFSRLLSAIMIGCRSGEELTGRFRTEPGRSAVNLFTLTLPEKLSLMDEGTLLGTDPTVFDSDENAPLLGLGFSLRLVRSMAVNLGGYLHFRDGNLILGLPAVVEDARQYGGGEGE